MKTLKRLFAGEDGAVMVEAVLVIPVMLILFLGMVEFSEAFTVRRKLGNVTTTIADLVAQTSAVTTNDLNDIISVSTPLLAPFPTAPLTLKLTSVGFNPNGVISELWSCSWGNVTTSPSCTATGDPYTTLPTGIIDPAGSIVVVDTTYNYTPVVGKFLLGGVTFSSTSYYKPRLAQFVIKN